MYIPSLFDYCYIFVVYKTMPTLPSVIEESFLKKLVAYNSCGVVSS
jgi:hypothetical protein